MLMIGIDGTCRGWVVVEVFEDVIERDVKVRRPSLSMARCVHALAINDSIGSPRRRTTGPARASNSVHRPSCCRKMIAALPFGRRHQAQRCDGAFETPGQVCWPGALMRWRMLGELMALADKDRIQLADRHEMPEAVVYRKLGNRIKIIDPSPVTTDECLSESCRAASATRS